MSLGEGMSCDQEVVMVTIKYDQEVVMVTIKCKYRCRIA